MSDEKESNKGGKSFLERGVEIGIAFSLGVLSGYLGGADFTPGMIGGFYENPRKDTHIEETVNSDKTYRSTNSSTNRVQEKIDEIKRKNARAQNQEAKQNVESLEEAAKVLDGSNQEQVNNTKKKVQTSNNRKKTDNKEENSKDMYESDSPVEKALYNTFSDIIPSESPKLYNSEGDAEEVMKGLKWAKKAGVDVKGFAGQLLAERGHQDIRALFNVNKKEWNKIKGEISRDELSEIIDFSNYSEEEINILTKKNSFKDIGRWESYRGIGEIEYRAALDGYNQLKRIFSAEDREKLEKITTGSWTWTREKLKTDKNINKEISYNQELNTLLGAAYINRLENRYLEIDEDVDPRKIAKEPLLWDINDSGELVYDINENQVMRKMKKGERGWPIDTADILNRLEYKVPDADKPNAKDQRKHLIEKFRESMESHATEIDIDEEYIKDNGLPYSIKATAYCKGFGKVKKNQGETSKNLEYVWDTLHEIETEIEPRIEEIKKNSDKYSVKR